MEIQSYEHGQPSWAEVVSPTVALGASIILPATDNELGQQYTILRDPQGARFGLNTRCARGSGSPPTVPGPLRGRGRCVE